MRVIEFTRDVDGSFPWLHIELQCLMTFPEDEERRKQAAATLMLERLSRWPSATVTVPTEWLRLAAAGPGVAETRRQLRNAVKAGTAAGEVMLELLSAHANDEVPRVGRAIEELTERRASYQTADGQRDSMRAVRSVENARKDFGSVVHFWAALVVATRRLPTLGDVRLYLETQPLHFLAVSVDLLDRASRLMSDNGSKAQPLFDVAQCWLPPADMDLPAVRVPSAG